MLPEKASKRHGPYGCRGRGVPPSELAKHSMAVSEALPEGVLLLTKLKECLPFSTGHGGGNHLAAANLHEAYVVLWIRLDAEPSPAILLLQRV
eukprot:2648819-Prymnesium_polylepis.1